MKKKHIAIVLTTMTFSSLLAQPVLNPVPTTVPNQASQAWYKGGNNSVNSGNILGFQAGSNSQIWFASNGVYRMMIDNGFNGINQGRISVGNDLPATFAPQDRMHLHQTSGTTAIRFTNSLIGASNVNGFQVGNQGNGAAFMRNFQPTQPVTIGTHNGVTSTTDRFRVGAFSDNGFISMGTVNTFPVPLALLHLSLLGPNVNMVNPGARGDMFRSDGDNAVTNTWKMFTSSPAGTTERFSVYVPALTTDAHLKSESGDMYFETALQAPAQGSLERMRISTAPGNVASQAIPHATKVSINYGGGAPPITNPIATLNIGMNPAQTPTGGQRNWMDVGTFMCGGSDNMYVGLKNEMPNSNIITGSDRLDAVINWGDNTQFPSPFGPDNLRFIFTSLQNPATATGAASQDGLEGMRMTPVNATTIFTGIGGDPTLNQYGPAQNSVNPTNTLEINSPNATNVPGGSSGLRFTNLNATSPTTPNVANGAVLSVDANGDVILVPGGAGSLTGAHNGTSLSTINPQFVSWGQDVGQPGNPGQLLSDREVPMNSFNVQFVDGGVPTVGANRFAIGQAVPLFFPTKVYIHNNIELVGALTETDATLVQIPFGPNPLVIAQEGFIRGLNDQSTSAIGVLGVSLNVVSKANIGVQGSAFHGQAQNIGVYGNVPTNSSGTGMNIGGYFEALSPNGSQNIGVYAIAPINPGVNYAAQFIGDILFDGSLSGINNIQTTSDAMFKTNVDSIPNALSLISMLQPRSYYMDTTNTNGLNFVSEKRYGLIAQDVENVLPELVGTAYSPTYFDSTTMTQYNSIAYRTLDYNSFIAILIAGMQEQQAHIDSLSAHVSSLESQVNNCCSVSRTTSSSVNTTDVTLTNATSIVLNQNVPNPFAEQTVISYYLPESTVKAQMLFYDANGKLIKVVDLEGRGQGQLNVFADDLSNGIYSYALVADGQIADSKTMVKTK